MNLILNTFNIKELIALRHKFTSDQLPAINSLLPKLAKEVFTTSLNNGFWDINEDLRAVAPLYVRDIDEAKLLIISEIIEYVEASRSKEGKSVVASILFAFIKEEHTAAYFKYFIDRNIKGTKEEEIADSVIRIMDLFTGVFPDREFTLSTVMSKMTKYHIHFSSSSQQLLFIISGLCSHKEGFDLEVTLKGITTHLIFGLDCNPIDVLLIMFIKNEYNKTRGFKHGKTF